MALSYDPPPRITPAGGAIYPGAAGGTINIQEGVAVLVFGRDGKRPDAQLESWITDIFSEPDDDHPFGSWVRPGRWWSYHGSNERAFIDPPLISIELRSAAEIEATRDRSSPDVIFAVSGWDDTPHFPPLDGLTGDGRSLTDVGPHKVYRVLIREDLASGGAGSAWSGRAFLLETVVHELGHGTQSFLIHLYNETFVAQNLCELFGQPVTHWDDPDLPWSQRVIEASAEFFKDVCFPRRRYSNRTELQLTAQDRFIDFKKLMFNYLENVYWDTDNTQDLHMIQDDTFDNIGTAAFVTSVPEVGFQNVGRTWFMVFVGDQLSGSAAAELPLGASLPGTWHPMNFGGIFRWPPVGDWNLRWNFTSGDWDVPGQYQFQAPPPGNPLNYVDARFSMSFYDLFTRPSDLAGPIFTPGTFYGEIDLVELLGTIGDPIPPSEGNQPIVVPPEIIAAVPPQGCVALIGESSRTLPKFLLGRDDRGFGSGSPSQWPWHEFSLQRPRLPMRDILYPSPTVSDLHGTILLGPMKTGRVVLDRKYVGYKNAHRS